MLELNIKNWMEHPTYLQQRAIINAEANYGDPLDQYITNRAVFEHSDEEKGLLLTLKHQWRKEIQLQGYTKRNVPTGINGSIKN